VRDRFKTAALVAAGTLLIFAAGTAVSLATSDKWPAVLQPYRRWAWWGVLALLGAAILVAAWQVLGQTDAPEGTSKVSGQSTGPVAGEEVVITGGLGPTAGRDSTAVAGGLGQTAGHDMHITSVTLPMSSGSVAELKLRRTVTIAPDGTRTITTEYFSEEVALQGIRQDSLEFGTSPEGNGG